MIAAAAEVTGEREIVVIGSQAILGTVDDPPAAMLVSMEADLFPRANPAKATEIDGSLGDGSQFHATFGYYAHGVGPETAAANETGTLPGPRLRPIWSSCRRLSAGWPIFP